MNDYEKTIEVLQNRVRALEERLTPCNGAVVGLKKWSPVGGDWCIDREPLSDDWIKDNMHLIHQDVSFTDLVSSIEKAHGIGVNDE